MFEFRFLCAGLKHAHTQATSLQLHERKTPDLRSLSDGRQVSGPQPGDRDKEALRCLLTLEQHIQVSQLLPTEPTGRLFPKPPTFHPFSSAISCDLSFLEDAIIFSGKNKYAAQSISQVWLFCDPMDCSPPGSSVHGILQARVLEWVAMPFSKGSSWCSDRSHVSCISRWILYHRATWEAQEQISSTLNDNLKIKHISENQNISTLIFLKVLKDSSRTGGLNLNS